MQIRQEATPPKSGDGRNIFLEAYLLMMEVFFSLEKFFQLFPELRGRGEEFLKARVKAANLVKGR